MKSHIRGISAILLAIISFAPALCAQSKIDAEMQVPFAFQYGAQRFAPGSCQIRNIGPYILQLRCGSSSAAAMVRYDIDYRAPRTGSALFRKYGDRYFLEEIRTAASPARIRIYQSKWQKQAARELEARNEAATLVELALVEPVSPVKR